eukprot:2131167-Amphidinium_carterae.1
MVPPESVQDLRHLIKDPMQAKQLPTNVLSKNAMEHPGHIVTQYNASQFGPSIDAFVQMAPTDNRFGFKCTHAKHRSLSYGILVSAVLLDLG